MCEKSENDKTIKELNTNFYIFIYISFILIVLFLSHTNLFNIFKKLNLLLITLLIAIITISICVVFYLTNKKNNKLKLIYSIIESSKFEKNSETNTIHKNDKIKSITSSDQQAKVLIAALEAIKEL